MHKFNRLKSIIVSGAVAVTSLAAPFTAAVSPSLTATAADGDNYAKLLQYSLYFYDANMCGKNVESSTRLSWRGNCHTSDEVDGGFHDAGDHAMFGQPQGYTAAVLGWSYYEFKDAYEATGQTAHLKTITDYFAKFFRDATVLNGDTVSKVCIEKGDGNTDHKYWGPPEQQGDRGGCKWTTGGAANITFEYAAALAANYVNFGNADDLKYAKALYNFSNQNTGTYSCEFYGSGESGSADEKAWAAGWLYLATKDQGYLNDLKSGPEGWWVMNWENVATGAAVLKGEITGDWSACHDLGGGDGYKFYDKWGSARHNATAQMCSLVAAKHNGPGSADWAKGQMQYLTGDRAFGNGQSYCLVVGFKDNASSHPHHRAASGTSTAESDGTPSAHVLVGALCGGPTDANGTYADKRSDYVCNEVACDYNAGFVGAAAGLYSFFKTGTAVDTSSIPGVKGGISDTSPSTPSQTQPVQTQPVQTQPVQTQPVQTQPVQTQPVTPSTGGNGTYTIKPGTKFKYSTSDENDRMLEFAWEDFGMKSGEVATKVEFTISTNNSKLGKWVGAFGTGTSVSPDYWYMSEEEDETFNSNTGTITWNIPSDVAKTINYNRSDCPLKLGIWYIEGDDIIVDSVTVYTSGGSSSTPATTQPVVTTTKPTTTTTTTTQPPQTQPVQTQPVQTQPPQVQTVQTQPVQTQPTVTSVTISGDANNDRSVNIADAVMIMQALCNPSKYGLTGSDSTHISQQGWVNADCCNVGDGVTNNDALAIQKYTLSIVTSLPTNS